MLDISIKRIKAQLSSPTSALRSKSVLSSFALFALIGGAFAYNWMARFYQRPSPIESAQLIQKADLDFYAGNPLNAIEKYREAWQIDKPAQAAVGLATVYYFINEKEKSAEWLKATPTTDFTDQWRTEFSRLLGQANPKTWISNRPLVSCHPPSSANPTGSILLLSGLDSSNAEAHLSRAGELSPDCDEAQWLVAEHIMQSRGIPEALEFIATELHKRPNAPGFIAAKAQLLMLKGELDAGEKALQNAIRANFRNPKPYLLLARLRKQERNRPARKGEYQRKRPYEITHASIEMYAKLTPYDPYGYLLVGNEYFEFRDFAAAAKNYHKALSLSPNIPGVNLKLAKISRMSGNLNVALKYVEAELNIEPNSAEAKRLSDELMDPKGK